MGFIRSGLRSEVTLNELQGQLIALRYAGIARNLTVSVPDRGMVTQDVVRAEIVTFSADGSNPKKLGETLVFQTTIAAALTEKPADWHGGVLEQIEQRSNKDFTVYVLNAPANNASAVFDRMEAALA